MIRLALLGKNISHSKSPELYKKILHKPHRYDLLDIQSEEQLPNVKELSKSYDGINITSPWKKNYINYAVEDAQNWGGVNCLRFREGTCEATNTDALALLDLIPEMQKKYQSHEWIILGDGVMSQLTCKILLRNKWSYQIISRSKGDDMSELDLSKNSSTSKTKIVINSCSRDYIFRGALGENVVFWDYNYSHDAHQSNLPQHCLEYVDGMGLLEAQAKHAVIFWELQ